MGGATWGPVFPLLCCVIPPFLIPPTINIQYLQNPGLKLSETQSSPNFEEIVWASQGWAAVLDFTHCVIHNLTHSFRPVATRHQILGAAQGPNFCLGLQQSQSTFFNLYFIRSLPNCKNQSDCSSSISCRSKNVRRRRRRLIIYCWAQMSSLASKRMACT